MDTMEAILNILLVAFNGVLAYVTYQLMIANFKNADATGKNAEAARSAAESANEHAQFAARQFFLAHRSYVLADDFAIEWHGDAPCLKFTVRDVAGVPTLVEMGEIQTWVGDIGSRPITTPTRLPISRCEVYRDYSKSVTHNLTHHKRDIADKNHVWFLIRIHYRDTASGQREAWAVDGSLHKDSFDKMHISLYKAGRTENGKQKK